MKLPKTIQKNCLLEILEVFESRVPEPLMIDQLDSVKAILAKQSNICCESYSEVLGCLGILHELGLLQLLEFVEDGDDRSYKVGNIYNGI